MDFTKNPAVISNGVYSSSINLGVRKAMPSVTGLSYETAVAQLNALGFHNIKKDDKIVTSDGDVNKVVSQSPSASSQSILGVTATYPLDTEIILTVGKEFGI